MKSRLFFIFCIVLFQTIYTFKMKKEDFFEKQGTFSMQCGMHSINNLLREQAYNKKSMEQICYDLSE